MDCSEKVLYTSLVDVFKKLSLIEYLISIGKYEFHYGDKYPRGYYYCNSHAGYHLTSLNSRGYRDPQQHAQEIRRQHYG